MRNVIPLARFYEALGIHRATGRRILKTDPHHPPLVQIGHNRFGVFEDDAAAYQQICTQRAAQPRPLPAGLRDPKRAAAASLVVRRAKAAARKAAAV